jgi:hypothetical protein
MNWSRRIAVGSIGMAYAKILQKYSFGEGEFV